MPFLSSLFGGIGTLLTGLFSGIGNLWKGFNDSGTIGTAYGLGQDIYNIYQTQKNNERTQALQEKLFERDDTSLSRLMKQYEDNGINPLLAVPNVSQGNTKGFETSALQSSYDYEQRKLAREQYNLSKERQELELKVMSDQNERARQQAENERTKEKLENQILRAKLNGAKAYAKVYGAGLGVDFGEDGYIPPYAQDKYEKIAQVIANVLNKIDTKLPNSLEQKEPIVPQTILDDPDITQPHSIINPTQLKYKGTTFNYVPFEGVFEYNGQKYRDINIVKYRIDYAKKHKTKTKQDNFSENYLLDDRFYEPMYLTQ